MKPHRITCGCPWCQENRESRIRHNLMRNAGMNDDWPERPRPQWQFTVAAVAGFICGAIAGGLGVVFLILWIVTR